MENYSLNSGGAIYSLQGIVNFYGDVCIFNNEAESSGGGIYLYDSRLVCEGNCKILENEVFNKSGLGGGVHAISSSIEVTKQRTMFNISDVFDRKEGVLSIEEYSELTSLIIEYNIAGLGGGIGLEGNSKLYVKVTFDSNTAAQYGGAIYINDYTTASTCASDFVIMPSVRTECFIQKYYDEAEGYNWTTRHEVIPIGFKNNSANIKGSVLFGGLLDRCTVSPLHYENYLTIQNVTKYINGVMYFERLSEFKNQTGVIASNPVRVCFCDTTQYFDCSYQPQTYKIMKGEEITLLLVAVDQVNQPVEAIIHSSVSYEGGLGEGQQGQNSGRECTSLKFCVKSPQDYEQLTIYADGPCHSTGISNATVHITFKPCTCPIAFQPSNETNLECKCHCDPMLAPYVTQCNQMTMTVKRKFNVWIGYCGYSNLSGQHCYLIHPNCPFDYCHSSTRDEKINLTNIENGSDSQCAFNRSGLLCGSCKSGLSLSIGSSSCIKCNKSWPGVFLAILLYILFFGIALVTVILVLDLTVATGTINGLLFYANVVGSSNNTFLLFPKPNLLTVFIKLLNVAIGFDACFSRGMDANAKAWLWLVFSAYVIALVFVVIQLSKFSPKFAQLLRKGNPVATLATLVLVFYVKLLRNTIKIFSFAVLKYPNGSHHVVWRPDASIKYLRGWHIPLFFTGVVIIAMVFAYTVLLFSWQWLLQIPNKKVFKWIRNTRLTLFMEANLAPYRPKYRFWTGLLLLVRMLLYLVQSLNVSNNTQLNLLAVGVIVTTLIVIKAPIGDKFTKEQFWITLNLHTITTLSCLQ